MKILLETFVLEIDPLTVTVLLTLEKQSIIKRIVFGIKVKYKSQYIIVGILKAYY